MKSMYLNQELTAISDSTKLIESKNQIAGGNHHRQGKRLSEISEKIQDISMLQYQSQPQQLSESDKLEGESLGKHLKAEETMNEEENEFLPGKYYENDEVESRGDLDEEEQRVDQLQQNQQSKGEEQQGLSFSRISRYSMVLANDEGNNRRLFDKTFDYCENPDAIYTAKPTRENVQNYCKNVCISCQLEKQIPIIALVYVERLLAKSGFAVTSKNWRKIILTAMIMASKIWDDESFENQNFAQAFTQFGVVQINEMERVFLNFIEYNLYIKGADYAKYYFIMREFAQKNKKSFPLRPLDLKTILFLQNNANKAQSNLREMCSNPLNKSF